MLSAWIPIPALLRVVNAVSSRATYRSYISSPQSNCTGAFLLHRSSLNNEQTVHHPLKLQQWSAQLTLIRSKHNPSAGLKTKQSAAKRLWKVGRGGLKFAPAGRSHLNGKKSSVRKMRLRKKVLSNCS